MKALITGITGQDGSYLAEFLLSKGYEVHGLIRRASTFNTDRIDHLYVDPHVPQTKLFLHYGDLSDSGQLTDLVYNIRPDEIYHLGAQSHVRVSFDMPEFTGDITGLGTTRLLEAIRRSGIKTKFYQASSSEMFGDSPPPQNELTPFRPRSPYAAAKVYSYWMTRNYREGYKLFAVNGILFNHESPRRGEQEPDDYVLGTGESHTVREFVNLAFDHAGVELEWKGNGVDEKGIIRSLASSHSSASACSLNVGDVLIEIDPRYFRPTEVEFLQCDPAKAKEKLGWEAKVKFDALVKMMVDADIQALEELKRCQDVIRKIKNNE